jgi:hypothetical protein
MRPLLIWFLTILCGSASAAPQAVFFSPSTTEPAILQFNNNHYSVVDPAVESRGRLVLFLPGTGATPAMYQAFPETAAGLGFHALALMYPNPSAINDLCAQFAPLNPDAAGNARLEVIDGTDRVSFVTVDSVNCIQNRLLKALQHLHATYPARGWGQYFEGNLLLWNKMVVSGHSQGGGMAAMLAKTRMVDRCILFASMDWWEAGNRPYRWMADSPQTPVDRWYLFAHERDQFLDFGEMQACAAALDVSRYGTALRTEAVGPGNYQHRHFLSTNLNPASAQANSYHGCPVVDAATPRMADGVTPVFEPVWRCMLLHQTLPIFLEPDGNVMRVVFSPGVLEQSEDLVAWSAVPSAASPLTVSVGGFQPRRFYRLTQP